MKSWEYVQNIEYKQYQYELRKNNGPELPGAVHSQISNEAKKLARVTSACSLNIPTLTLDKSQQLDQMPGPFATMLVWNTSVFVGFHQLSWSHHHCGRSCAAEPSK